MTDPGANWPALDTGQVIEDYRRLIKLANSEIVPTRFWFDHVAT